MTDISSLTKNDTSNRRDKQGVMMHKAFISWSGGKDCCLAGYRAVNNGLDIDYLLNMANDDGTRSRSHGLPASIFEFQSHAMGIPLVQRPASRKTYAEEFGKAILYLKQQGITDGVFGDIDVAEHRRWIEQICKSYGVTPHLPLWGERQDVLIREFINSGFKAVVVATKASLLDSSWLGRKLDGDFLADLSKYKSITPCGEAGEYHTLVVDGPIFKSSLNILESDPCLIEDNWFLNIQNCTLSPK